MKLARGTSRRTILVVGVTLVTAAALLFDGGNHDAPKTVLLSPQVLALFQGSGEAQLDGNRLALLSGIWTLSDISLRILAPDGREDERPVLEIWNATLTILNSTLDLDVKSMDERSKLVLVDSSLHVRRLEVGNADSFVMVRSDVGPPPDLPFAQFTTREDSTTFNKNQWVRPESGARFEDAVIRSVFTLSMRLQPGPVGLTVEGANWVHLAVANGAYDFSPARIESRALSIDSAGTLTSSEIDAPFDLVINGLGGSFEDASLDLGGHEKPWRAQIELATNLVAPGDQVQVTGWTEIRSAGVAPLPAFVRCVSGGYCPIGGDLGDVIIRNEQDVSCPKGQQVQSGLTRPWNTGPGGWTTVAMIPPPTVTIDAVSFYALAAVPAPGNSTIFIPYLQGTLPLPLHGNFDLPWLSAVCLGENRAPSAVHAYHLMARAPGFLACAIASPTQTDVQMVFIPAAPETACPPYVPAQANRR